MAKIKKMAFGGPSIIANRTPGAMGPTAGGKPIISPQVVNAPAMGNDRVPGMGPTAGGKPALASMPPVTTGGGMPRPGMAPGGMGGMGATGGGKPAPAMPMKKGGSVSASKRADGIAQRGKTKGRIV